MTPGVRFPKVATYKTQKFYNPEDEYMPDGSPRDPKDKVKDKSYFLDKAKYLYSAFLTDNFTIGYSSSLEYAINRSYSFGNQSNTKYMDILTPKNAKGERKAYANFSYDNLAIFPKFRDIAISKLKKFDYKIEVECLEEDAVLERQRKKMLVWVKQQEAEFIASIREITGMPAEEQNPQEQPLPIIPTSIQELDMLEGMGSFKLPLEMALQKKLTKNSFPLSQWKEIEGKLKEDGIDIGVMAVQCYNDPVEGVPMVRYVDPQYLIVRHTRDQSFERISDGAEIRFMTIAQLREFGLSEKEIQQAATAFSGDFTNELYQTQYNFYNQNRNALDRFIIPVLDMDFESFCTTSLEYRNIAGVDVPFQLPAGSEKSTRKTNRFEKNRYMRRYRAKWVIGTDIVFDYGYQFDVPFDNQNMPICSYKVYRCAIRSMTSRCIATIDDLQLAVLKFRAAWAKAKPSGIRVEWGSISNMTFGGEKMDPKDILRMYNQSGDLVYRAQMIDGRYVAGQAPPVEELKGGMGPLLDEFIKTFQLHLTTLRELTAIGEVVDGTLGASDQLVGVAKMAEAATSDAHRNVLTGYQNIKERVATDLCIRWQNYTILQGGSKVMSAPYGGNALEIIRLSAEEAKRKVRVICEAEIDDGIRDRILAAADQSLAAAKQGAAGISMSDYFFIMEALQSGNLKWAAMYLNYREEQEKKRIEQVQAQNMQMNGQNMQVQEKMKSDAAMALKEAEKETIVLQTEANIAEIEAKGQQDRQTEWFKKQLETGALTPPINMPGTTPSGAAPSPGVMPPPSGAPMGMGDPSQMQAAPTPEQGMQAGQPVLQ